MVDPDEYPRLALPFQALELQSGSYLDFDSMLDQLPGGQVQIQRSYPGAPQAIGWTIFSKFPHAYAYRRSPLFRSERGARSYLRRTWRRPVSILEPFHSHFPTRRS